MPWGGVVQQPNPSPQLSSVTALFRSENPPLATKAAKSGYVHLVNKPSESHETHGHVCSRKSRAESKQAAAPPTKSTASSHAELSKSEREAKYLFTNTRTQDALSKWTQTQFKDNLLAIDGKAFALIASLHCTSSAVFSTDTCSIAERYRQCRRHRGVRSTVHRLSGQGERFCP